MRVRTDVAAVPKLLDYAVPEKWSDPVVVGTRVRVPLHGRSVRGWVVQDEVAPPDGVDVLPLRAWLGWGPPPSVVALSEWAAWRWAGAPSSFLRSASPERVIRSLQALPATGTPPPRTAAPAAARAPAPAEEGEVQALVREAVGLNAEGTGVLRLPPTTDLITVVTALAGHPRVAGHPGSVLVLVPSVGWAERLTGRLLRRGLRATMDWAEARAGWPIVVGSRAAAWAPVPELAAALVLDAHDLSYREESAPTYSAVEVVVERARRSGSPCLLTSPCPPPALTLGRNVTALSPVRERAGWAAMELVDRRGADPRTGLFSEEFVRLARAALDSGAGDADHGPLVCVYNRKGRARLLACRHCGELARCTACGAAAQQEGEGLRCPRCGVERPLVCAACGRLRMKTLRAGVARLREEVAALLGVAVEEVSGSEPLAVGWQPSAPVVIGTEAVLHRVRRAAAVAFLDIDLHLLAARVTAVEETLALLVRASRLVGPRRAGSPTARVQLQTRAPEHGVLAAVVRGEPAPVLAEDEALRRASGLPPFSALALVSGPLAEGFVAALRPLAVAGGVVSVSALADDRFLLQAPTDDPLCDLLARVPRPAGRGLRIAVDPDDI